MKTSNPSLFPLFPFPLFLHTVLEAALILLEANDSSMSNPARTHGAQIDLLVRE